MSKSEYDVSSLIDSLNTKEVQLNYIDKSDLAFSLYEVTFDDLEDYITVENDSADRDQFVVTVPVIKEDDLLTYKNGKDRMFLPARESFIKLSPKLKKYPFGLLEIEFVCYESHLNLSDNRYLKDKMLFKNSLYFIFDYEKKVYLMVDTNSLEKAKYELKNDLIKGIDEIKSDRVKLYLERENELKIYKNKLMSTYHNLRMRLFDFAEVKYSNNSNDSIKNYLIECESFFKNEYKNLLDLNYIFTKISESEYDTYKYIINNLIERLNASIDLIDSLDQKYNSISKQYAEKETYEKFKYIEFTLDIIAQLFRERRNENFSYEGYVLVADKKGKNIAVESLLEIEKRTMKLEYKITSEQIQQEKAKILEQRS